MDKICKKIRRTILELLYKTQTCHLGSDFSCVEILATLYLRILKDNDHFIMSKGHGAACLYSVLAEAGKVDRKELFDTYAKEGTKYLNLVNREVPGVEFSTGALGHGLPAAIGFALADKDSKTYCMISDGELDAGTTWESALFAAHHSLDNLVLIIDNNAIQACGFKEDIISVEPIEDKFKAFGWTTYRIDGHNTDDLEEILKFKPSVRRPTVIIADTIKGKGFDKAEGSVDWHYQNLDKTQFESAMEQNI